MRALSLLRRKSRTAEAHAVPRRPDAEVLAGAEGWRRARLGSAPWATAPFPAAPSAGFPYQKIAPGRAIGHRLTMDDAERAAHASRQAPPTAPQPALPLSAPPVPSGPVLVARTDRAAAEQALHGLSGLSWPCVDIARRQEGLTYAEVLAAAGPLTAPGWPADGPAVILGRVFAEWGAPLGDPLAPAWRPGALPNQVRHGEAVSRRSWKLAYPSAGLARDAWASAYRPVMEHASRITGTQGSAEFLPASGGAL